MEWSIVRIGELSRRFLTKDKANDYINFSKKINAMINHKRIFYLLALGMLMAAIPKSAYAQTLHGAVKSGIKADVETMLAKGTDVNSRDENGQTPLFALGEIIRGGHPFPNKIDPKGIAELLLAKGADVNSKDNSGNTPLHVIVRGGEKDAVELLLAKGANVNAKNSDGKTPLHLASNEAVAKWLLAKGADVNAKDNIGETPLFNAIYKAVFFRENFVALLLAHGADANAKDNAGQTPLGKATIFSASKEIREMLENPAPKQKTNPRELFGQLTEQLKNKHNEESTPQEIIAPQTINAQTAQEQLKQMVAQLQKSPTDNALREKIIILAAELKPPSAIPEEAERRMVRGTAAFKGSKSVADYQDAIKEFELAVAASPWYSDAYFNLGVAQDKAEKYTDALQSLKFALMKSPDSKEIKALLYEVEYRLDKVNTATAKVQKEAEDARWQAKWREDNKHLWAQNLVQWLQRNYGNPLKKFQACSMPPYGCNDEEAKGSNWNSDNPKMAGRNWRFVIELTDYCGKDQISMHYDFSPDGASYHGWCGSVRGPNITDVEWTDFRKKPAELKFSDSRIDMVYSCNDGRRCEREVYYFEQ